MTIIEKKLKDAAPIKLITFLAKNGRASGSETAKATKNFDLAAVVTAEELIRRRREGGIPYGRQDFDLAPDMAKKENLKEIIELAHSLLEEYVSIRSMAESKDLADEFTGELEDVDSEDLMEEADDFYYAAQWLLEYASLGGFLTEDASTEEAMNILETELDKDLK